MKSHANIQYPEFNTCISKARMGESQQMDIVENQALMDDSTTLLPRRGHTREHRSVNQMNFNPFPTDEFDEFPYNCGDDCIVVFKSDFGGQLKPSHKIPKALWMNFSQEEKDIWLSLSVDTRKGILSCSANDSTSIQQDEG